ncbi:hypothetical protein [Nocardioides sp.]|uniref:hypothetical protein n=1 Tax=Nocardioides sp. TaxID=35761 RepID=UPI0019AD4F9F|nr:hypothetical protein [Nocardioides sp.]MBC7275024.1 hypothetical protein [Nocardioides sp.]
MTDEPPRPATIGQILRGLTLEGIVLWDCSVERGSAPGSSTKHVNGSINLEPGLSEDGLILVLAKGTWEFTNDDEESIVTVSATFAITYEGDLSSADVDQTELVTQLGRSAIVQVTPFHREFLATITNRLGIDAFYLPLMRKNDIKIVAK